MFSWFICSFIFSNLGFFFSYFLKKVFPLLIFPNLGFSSPHFSQSRFFFFSLFSMKVFLLLIFSNLGFRLLSLPLLHTGHNNTRWRSSNLWQSLLLTEDVLTVGLGKTFWRVGQFFFYENGQNLETKSRKFDPKVAVSPRATNGPLTIFVFLLQKTESWAEIRAFGPKKTYFLMDTMVVVVLMVVVVWIIVHFRRISLPSWTQQCWSCCCCYHCFCYHLFLYWLLLLLKLFF